MIRRKFHHPYACPRRLSRFERGPKGKCKHNFARPGPRPPHPLGLPSPSAAGYLRETKLNGRTKRAAVSLARNRVNPGEPLNSFLSSALNRSPRHPRPPSSSPASAPSSRLIKPLRSCYAGSLQDKSLLGRRLFENTCIDVRQPSAVRDRGSGFKDVPLVSVNSDLHRGPSVGIRPRLSIPRENKRETLGKIGRRTRNVARSR